MLTREAILDYFREPFFWKIYNAYNESNTGLVWNLFEGYNLNYSKYGPSKWNSEVLSLAERYMRENDEWRFIDFFRNWNPFNLRDQDWREVKENGNVFKPLAVKATRKSFKILKEKDVSGDLSWLENLYKRALETYSNDEWLLREYALLLVKIGDFDRAIVVFKKLVQELSDKYYIWQEFSTCFPNDKPLVIGMLAKALKLENNEDFLGDIRLTMAKRLIEEGLLSHAANQLQVYRRHRELKSWRVSEEYHELELITRNHYSTEESNADFFEKYLTLAESCAYGGINWQEVVFVGKKTNDKGSERFLFNDGQNIEFSVSKRRLISLLPMNEGEVFRVRLYSKEVEEPREDDRMHLRRTVKVMKHSLLVAERTIRDKWDILNDTFAYVSYVNESRQVVHAITNDNKEVFFNQGDFLWKVGDFLKAKYFTIQRPDQRVELRELRKVEREEALINFKTSIVIVDGVNESKKLFHYVLGKNIHGVIHFSFTELRPRVGEFLNITYVLKKRENRTMVDVLKVEQTEFRNPDLEKRVKGNLRVSYYDNSRVPAFAFLGDYYVSRHLLAQADIHYDCEVKAHIIYATDQWKVIEINKGD